MKTIKQASAQLQASAIPESEKGRAKGMKTATSGFLRAGSVLVSTLLLSGVVLSACQHSQPVSGARVSCTEVAGAARAEQVQTVRRDGTTALSTATVATTVYAAGSTLGGGLAVNMLTADPERTVNKGKDNVPVVTLTADVKEAAAGSVGGIDAEGVYHSQAPLYMNSERKADEKVVLYLRTKKDNVVQASVWVRNYSSASESISAMEKTDPLDKTGRYEYWKVTLSPSSYTREYMFQLRTEDGDWVYYGVKGLSAKRATKVGEWFVLAPNGATVPEWSKNTVFYSMLVDGFFNGDTENDPNSTRVVPVLWGSKRHTGNNWYGGDMEGVQQKLSYIKDTLGAKAIYTNPTFTTDHNAGYGQEDYTTINPYYGTNKEYANLISAVHKNGMRIINDGVWLYITWATNRYTNEGGRYPGGIGAFQIEDSPYHDFVDWLQWPTEWRALYYNYPSINFDSEFTLDLMIRRPDSTLQYFLRNPYNLDGWRLDVPSFGGNVHTEDQIVGLMKTYMRSISNDKLLVGEYGSDYAMSSGSYDSIWYYGNLPVAIRSYLGVTDNSHLWTVNPEKLPQDQTSMLTFIAQQLNRLPWQNGQASQMQLSTHDTTRIADALNKDQSSIERAIALQMTVAGSPSIYHGDEIGMTAPGTDGYYRMNGFDWDTDNWNMDTFNTYRSLIELRESYDDAFRNGGFYPLVADNTAKVMAYGRYTAKQGVVTLLNNDTRAHNVQIPMYGMGVVNGTYVYDWENGNKYQVQDGCIVATVAAGDYAMLVYGGTVLESSYTQAGLESYDIGTATYLGRTYGTPEALTVYGNGTIGGKSDAFRFVGTELDGDAAVTVKVTGVSAIADTGAAGLMLRDDRTAASAYAVIAVSKSGVWAGSRASAGAAARKTAVKSVGDTVWLKLERHGNVFTAFYAADSNGSAGTWNKLDTQSIFMTQHVRGGAVVTGSGNGVTAKFAALSATETATTYGDSFDKSVLNSMWTYVPAGNSCKLSSGSLQLASTNQITRLLSKAPAYDWSSRAELKGVTLTNGDEMGLVAWTTENQQARIKRVMDNGVYSIVFETVSGGTVIERARIKDAAPASSVYVQLQKLGGLLSAMISTDNKNWTYLADAIWYNIAESYNGVYVSSAKTLTASFGSFEYGAALSGKAGYVQIPAIASKLKVLYLPSGTGRESLEYGEGDWDYTDAGYIQKTTSGKAEMYINRTYSGSYRLDAEVEMRGTGGAGMAFGVMSGNSPHTSGYQVMIRKGNLITLSYEGRELKNVHMEGLDYQNENRLTIYVEEHRVRVYVNKTLALSYTGDIITEGIAACITQEAQATFRNLYQLDADTATVHKTYLNGFSNVAGGLRSAGDGLFEATLAYGVSDFTMKTTLTLNSLNADQSFTGLALYGTTSATPLTSGYNLLVKSGSVELWKDGSKVQSKALAAAAVGESLELTVKVQNGQLTVAVGGQTLLTSALTGYAGGRLSFVANQCAAVWNNISITQ